MSEGFWQWDKKVSTPREFWIEQLNPQEDIVYRSADRVAYKAPEQIVHVIEYSAYDNLRRQVSIYEKALELAALGETQFDGVEVMHAARAALEEGRK